MTDNKQEEIMKEESQELTVIEQDEQRPMTKAERKRELKLLEQGLEHQFQKQEIIQQVMLKRMEAHHFQGHGYGDKIKFKLTRAGAQYIRQFAGVTLEFTPLPRTEGDNDSYLHQCICKATMASGETCEALGSCSSKHQAFGTGTKALEAVDESNIIKTAQTNSMVRVFEIYFGLSGIPQERFFSMATFMPDSVKYEAPKASKPKTDKTDTRKVEASGEIKAIPWKFLLIEFSERANDYYKLTEKNAFIEFLWYDSFGDGEKYNNRNCFLKMEQIVPKKKGGMWDHASQVQRGYQALLDALN